MRSPSLGCPLRRCNYDGLLERYCADPASLGATTAWSCASSKGQQDGILHLHGHYNDPDSVVLGIESYKQDRRQRARPGGAAAAVSGSHAGLSGFGAGLRTLTLARSCGGRRRWCRAPTAFTFAWSRRRSRRPDGRPSTKSADSRAGIWPQTRRFSPLSANLIAETNTKTVCRNLGSRNRIGKKGNPGPAGSRCSDCFQSHDSLCTREKLRDNLKTAADFDAFCLDYFNEIYSRFTSGDGTG